MRKNCFKATVLALFAIITAVAVDSTMAQPVQLVTLSTTWRYNQTGTSLPANWTSRTYNDTVVGWEGPGLGLFGYEDNEAQYSALGAPFNTRFPNPQTAGNFRTNFYFRAHFTMPSYAPGVLAAISLLTTNYIDDGAVIYINGVEMFRFNMPPGTPNAASFGGAALTEPIVHITNNVPGNLLVGDNVVAVELHQANLTSSDEVFGMTITAILPSAIAITSQPVGSTNSVNTPVTLSVGVTGSSPSYQWYANGVAIQNATSATYNAPSNLVGSVNYFVVVSNSVNVVTSSVATVVFTGDTTPIALLSAVSGFNAAQTNQVLMSFDKRVQSSTAVTNPNNYKVLVLGTTNIIPVTNVQVSAAQIKLSLAGGLVYGGNYIVMINNLTGTNFLQVVPNMIGVTTSKTNPSTRLFAMSQGWTYYEPDHDIGTNWIGTNYVGDLLSSACLPDGCWGSGSAIFCYEQDGGTPCIGSLNSGALDQGLISYYFRTRFVAPSNTPASGVLFLTNYFDDGLVMYLNGREIYRANMPAGVPQWNTRSTGQVPAAGAPQGCTPVIISITNLMMSAPATNVLAAELHESGVGAPGDNDIFFGASLDFSSTAFYTSPLPPKLNIVRTSATTDVVSWSTNVAGYTWGLEFSTSMLKTNTAWTALPNFSPYTNTISGRRFFRNHVLP